MSDDDGTAPGSGPSPIFGATRGVCRVCGQPARTDRAFYCETDRPIKKSGSASRTAKARQHKAPKSSGTGRPVGRPRSLASDVENLYLMVADVWEITSPECADALRTNAPKLGDAWEGKARQDPRVRAMLEGLTGSAGWAGLALAHVPIVRAVVGVYVIPAARARQGLDGAGVGADNPPIDPATLDAILVELEGRWPGLTGAERRAEHAQAAAFNVVLPVDRFPV